MLIAYFSPELTFPIASALATVAGVVALVGRAPFRLAARAFRSLAARWKKTSSPSEEKI